MTGSTQGISGKNKEVLSEDINWNNFTDILIVTLSIELPLHKRRFHMTLLSGMSYLYGIPCGLVYVDACGRHDRGNLQGVPLFFTRLPGTEHDSAAVRFHAIARPPRYGCDAPILCFVIPGETSPGFFTPSFSFRERIPKGVLRHLLCRSTPIRAELPASGAWSSCRLCGRFPA